MSESVYIVYMNNIPYKCFFDIENAKRSVNYWRKHLHDKNICIKEFIPLGEVINY